MSGCWIVREGAATGSGPVLRTSLALLLLVLGAHLAAAEPGDGLRERLASQRPPWYDASRDDWRRVEVPRPKEPEPERSDQVEGGGLALPASPFAWAMALLVAGILVWVAWWLWRSREAFLPPAAEPLRPGQVRAAFSGLELSVGLSGDPEEGLRQALAAGDWGRAVVWLYALHLAELDRAGAIRLQRHATNRRYQRELDSWLAAGRGRPSLVAGLLQGAIEAFERTYFGAHQADRDGVESLRRSRQRLAAALARQVES